MMKEEFGLGINRIPLGGVWGFELFLLESMRVILISVWL